MLTKLAILCMIPFAMTMGLFLTTDTMFVDVNVDEGPGGDNFHIFVPVPMFLASAAMNMVPADEMEIECEELWRYREPISKVIEELRRAPDGELVRVEERDTFVTIEKKGNDLRIHVIDGEEEVKVKFPLSAARRFLARLDGPVFNAKDLLAATNNTMFGEVVNVNADDAQVRIWVF
jgi:hypothetical protein